MRERQKILARDRKKGLESDWVRGGNSVAERKKATEKARNDDVGNF